MNLYGALEMSLKEDYKNLSEDEAEQLIVKSLIKIKEIDDEKKADEHLQSAKSVVKDLGKAYADAKKLEKAKISALLAQRTSVIDSFEAKRK